MHGETIVSAAVDDTVRFSSIAGDSLGTTYKFDGSQPRAISCTAGDVVVVATNNSVSNPCVHLALRIARALLSVAYVSIVRFNEVIEYGIALR